MTVRTQVPSIPSSTSIDPDSSISKTQRAPRCAFSTSDRRCTMLRHDSHLHAHKHRDIFRPLAAVSQARSARLYTWSALHSSHR